MTPAPSRAQSRGRMRAGNFWVLRKTKPQRDGTMQVFTPTTLTKLRKTGPTVLLIYLFSLSSLEAGFFDVLRGEADAAIPSFQRVAFVGSARVKEVQGEAERLAGIDSWKPLEKGAELMPGDLVRTRNGTVVLRMTDSGSFVKVTPQTILRLLECESTWDRGALSGTEEKQGFAVRSCRGKAFVREPGQEWKSVEVNVVLADGSEVRTEPETVVDLFNIGKQRAVRIQGPAVVNLQESAVAGKSVVGPSFVATVRP